MKNVPHFGIEVGCKSVILRVLALLEDRGRANGPGIEHASRPIDYGKPNWEANVRRLTIFALVLVLVGCGSDSTGPEQQSQTPNLAGTWNFSETMNDSEHDISCNNAGTINISQSGSTFNGTYQMQGVCTGPGGSIDNSGSGSISGGQISGSSVSFFADFCQYSGTLSGGTTPNQITGSGTCTIQDQGTTFNFDANFQASR